MTGMIDAGFVTDVGKVRSENQDYAGLFNPTDPAEAGVRGRVFIVCDGMGGHHGGSIASELTVKGFLAAWNAASHPALEDRVNASIGQANLDVRARAATEPALRSMGTTAVMIAVDGSHVVVAHIGDSRCYFFRGGRAELLTRDHTYVNDLVEAGLITPEKAKTHHERNIITRCVGMADTLKVDFSSRTVQPGDAFLMCSDGLHNHVEPTEMQKAIAESDAATAARAMVDLANARGGDDNITCMVVKIQAVEPPKFAVPEAGQRLGTRLTPVPGARRKSGPVDHGLETGDDITRMIDTSSIAKQSNGPSLLTKVAIGVAILAVLAVVAKWMGRI